MRRAFTEFDTGDQQPTETGRVGSQLMQFRPDLRWHILYQPFGAGAVIESQVRPQSAEHRGKQTLAGSVEPGNPSRWHIAGPPGGGVARLQNEPQPLGVSAFTDESLQLLAQDSDL